MKKLFKKIFGYFKKDEPKSVAELLFNPKYAREKEEIIRRAIRGANEDQRKLMEEYRANESKV